MRLTSPLLGFALAALLAPPSHAQSAPQPAPTAPFGEEVEVSEVLIDVQVTDRDGNVIVGLVPADFLVEEDGRRVELADVTFYSNRPRLDADGRQATKSASERYFVLVVDDQKRVNVDLPGALSRQMDAARAAREWLSRLRLDDWVAVASYDTSLAVHSDFSRDRGVLAKAIENAVAGEKPSGNWPSRMPAEDSPSLLRQLPRGNELIDATPTIYQGLQVLAQATDALVGRKNLVLLSTGFGEVKQFGQWVPDPRYWQPMEEALNDANVAVYAIDLTPAGLDHPLQSSLSHLANETGGRYYPNVVSFGGPLDRIAEETSGYYLLAYRSPHPRGSSGFQRVTVKVANPEFRLKAREGYRYGG